MNLPRELDAALAMWRNRLRRAGITSIATLNELESHARDRTLKLIDAGIAPSRAFEDAIAAQGSPEALRQEFSRVRTDRKISHFFCMWIGLGTAAFLIVLLSSSWWLPRHLNLGVLPILLGIASLPFVLAYTAHHAAAWRVQSAISVSSSAWSIGSLRVIHWLTGAAGLLWWGIAADWLLSLLVTFILFGLLIIQAAAITGRARYTARRIWPDITACVCLLALILSAAWTAWPMRLLFLASRDQLESLATRVEAGQTFDVPVWAGAFRIARTEIRTPGWGGGTCLWVFANTGHPTGLVRSDKRGGPGANVNRKIRLSEHWYYLSED